MTDLLTLPANRASAGRMKTALKERWNAPQGLTLNRTQLDWRAAMQSTEQWAPIRSWEGLYSVSDHGNVRNDRTGYVLKPAPIRRGYLTVTLADKSRRVLCSVHRLVADAFLDGAGPLVRHLDGNKLNNAATNLCWGTGSENSLDAVQHGTHRNAKKTRCKNGHSLVDARRDNLGRRVCAECVRLRRERLVSSKEAEHGKPALYEYGCRCALCVSAYAAHQKAKRAARKAANA